MTSLAAGSFVAATGPAALPAAAAPRRIGSAKQLFIDELLVASSRQVTLTMNPASKTGERSIVAEHPWEDFYAGGWNTVLEQDGAFTMWYEASSSEAGRHLQMLAVARSRDGIHWEKPRLGIVEFRGSKNNNLVLTDTVGTVFVDPKSADGKRFKFAARKKPGLWIFTSADGLHWAPLGDGAVLSKGHFDTQNQVFWDDRIGKYVGYVRRWEPLRKVGRSETSDLGHWPEPEIVFAYDDKDPFESDHYNACVVKYPFAPDVYFMFPSPYYHFPGKKNDGPLDIQLATSRDGIRWDRRFREPYVRLGLDGSPDGGSIYMTVGMLRRGAEIWMYYTGYDFTHGAYKLSQTKDKGVVSRLVQRLDGFVSADAAYGGGELVTVPVEFEGARLELNVDTGALGSARVEVLDAAGRPIAGFTAADCDPIIGNSVARRVTWKGSPDVAALAGRPVSLRFAMRSTKLYAFQFVRG
jgi:hypothetical protein